MKPEQLQKKIDIFVDILSRSSMSGGQKQLCVNIVQDLIGEINIKENIIKKVRAAKFHLEDPSQVEDFINRHVAVVNMCGGLHQMENITPDNYGFMLAHQTEIKQPVTIDAILKTAKSYNLFVTLNNKEPENINQLRKFIHELND